MKPCRWSSLVVICLFVFSVLAPYPLAAAENSSTSINLHRFDHFFGSSSAGERFNDGAFAKLGLLKLRKDLDSKSRSSWGAALRTLKEKMLTKASETIDEHGAEQFRQMVLDITGQSLLENVPSGASEQVLSSLLMKEISANCDLVSAAIEDSSRAELEEVLSTTESIVDRINNGATDEELAQSLNVSSSSESTHTGPKGRRVIKKVFKVLMSVFMCAAVGAIGLVSLGFLAAAVTGGSILLSAAGGAVTIACIVGIFKYIKEAINVFRKAPPAGESKASTLFVDLPPAPLNITVPEQYLCLPGGAY